MAVKILAADDSATLRRVLQMTFAGEAVEVHAVDSGEAAVERALQGGAPDLVIADVSMSMDGYEVSRALKSNAGTQNVAVIVLASQHHPYDAEKGRAAGVDDHILKPYDSQAMIEKAKEVLARPRNRAAGAPAAVAAAPARPPGLPQPPAAPAQPPPRPPLPGIGTQPHATAPAAPRPQAPGAGRTQTAAQAAVTRATVAFAGGAPPVQAAPAAPKPVAPPQVAPSAPNRHTLDLEAAAAPKPTPSPAQAAPKPAAAPVRAAAAATAPSGEMASRLADLGLSREQVEGVLGLSREIIERVVWEVVPDLAETIIREEIKRLTAE